MKAIFFDRDGIVNKKLENDYVKNINEFKFIDVFFVFFELCKKYDYMNILVTNQQCVGKKIITAQELDIIHNYMQEELISRTGKGFDAIYYSPDLADSGSITRKPEAGMFFQAINKFNIVPGKSWTIGDSISDVIAGKRAATNTVLIGNYSNVIEADFIFKTLNDAFYFFKDVVFNNKYEINND